MNDVRKTVLITGASSGIGLETAAYFHEKGWNVVAALRNPEKCRAALNAKSLEDLVRLDVTNRDSVREAVRWAVDKFGRIDVLVNNAGYAVYGPFEATSPQQAVRQFDTNLFGLIAVIREILPVFRRQKGGVLVNVTSMGGRIGFPLYALYNGTKWAVEGFTESIKYELKPLNVKVRLVEPGVIRTDFYGRSLDKANIAGFAEDYDEIMRRGRKLAGENALRRGSSPRAVARAIYRAAKAKGNRLRYPVGSDARMVWCLRRLLPERMFFWIFEKTVLYPR